MAAEDEHRQKRQFPKRRIAAAAFILLAVVGVLIYVRWGRTPSNQLVLYGNVDVREVDLAFNESDRIVRMHVEEGDPVEPGQLLAELDGARLEHAMLEAEARVAAQRAVVAELHHGSRPEEIQRARAEVAAAKARLRDARTTAGRFAQAIKTGAASKKDADDAAAALKMARAALDAAQQNLELALQGPRVEDIQAAEAQLRADENALELAQHRLADTKLYAPVEGVVLTRVVEPGAVVLPNSPVYTIALTNPVWVRTYASETILGRVYSGMKAEITTDSLPDRHYSGWVGFISPTAEFTPKPVETPELRTSLVYRLRVYVDNPDHTLLQGMPVTVALIEGERRQPAGAPARAVLPRIPDDAAVPEASADGSQSEATGDASRLEAPP
ncbi:MAG: efflux RND transporter periplasmic adaptor subunit [Myxococcales bacterium]|jgi:HlyD family secretion protein